MLVPGMQSSGDCNQNDAANTDIHFVELEDRDNLLKTAAAPEPSTMVACLGSGKSKSELRIWRIYSVQSEKNSCQRFDLPGGQLHTVKQFCVEYLAVS